MRILYGEMSVLYQSLVTKRKEEKMSLKRGEAKGFKDKYGVRGRPNS